ncbi:MAG TPA: glycerol-3-phosphate 1-O-acyltransferase PlsY [Gammaproteobacteria bacterium]
MIELGLKVTLAYLIGSVLGSLVVGYVKGGVDIRKLGSGNAGGTNALRTQGKAFAFWVLVIDVGKGILAAAWIPGLAIPGIGIDSAVPRELVLYGTALAAIVGHVFPVWFGFRGGKGGATAAGLLVYLDPALGAFVIACWIGVILLTGFVGLATMSSAVAAAALIGFTRLSEEPGFFWFAVLVAALIVYTHRGNIRRMVDRTEPRFGRAQSSK